MLLPADIVRELARADTRLAELDVERERLLARVAALHAELTESPRPAAISVVPTLLAIGARVPAPGDATPRARDRSLHMSEYQYYEFLSVDRALTPKEQRELRDVSSRAEITPYRFTNHYEYGDFKGDPRRWMERYFDGFLYFANWNSRALSLRVPRRLFDLPTARRYCRTPSASARAHGPWLILDFAIDEEDADSDDSREDDLGGCLGAIAPVRTDLAAGDLRLLFLGWLLSVQTGEASESEPPPCPPGMDRLSGPLVAFADFMRIDPGLLARAVARAPRSPDEAEDFRRWASRLPQRTLVRWLEHLVFPQGAYARAELLSAYRRERGTSQPVSSRPTSKRPRARPRR